MQTIDQILDRVKQLPPAPRLLPRLLQLLRRDDVSAEQVVQLLRFDPSLTAHVLRLCNSAFFGTGRKCESLDEAVLRLGFHEVYLLVTSLCCSTMLSKPQQGYGLDQGELWKHSVVCAIAAGALADQAGSDSNLVFTSALLHDLGKVVLSETLADQYSRVVIEIEQHEQSFVEAEKQVLGVSHPEVGGRLLERWEFSPALTAGVLHHHHPEEAGEHQAVAAQVYLGNTVAHFLGHSYGHHAFAMRWRNAALQILGLSEDAFLQVVIATSEQLKTHQSLLELT